MLVWPIRIRFPAVDTFANTPTLSASREWNTGNIGILSRFLGLDAGFRKKIIQLFDLAYASKLRLIFCISAGFYLCHRLIRYVPTVEIIVEEAEDEEVEEEAEDNSYDEESSDSDSDEESREETRDRNPSECPDRL